MDRRDEKPSIQAFTHDVALWLAATWALYMTYCYWKQLPPVTPDETMYLLLADVNFFFRVIGIVIILLLCSNWFGSKLSGGFLIGLHAWSMLVSRIFIILFLWICSLYSIGNQWSGTVIKIASNQAASLTIELPFMPITQKLIQNVTPFEASVLQLCLTMLLCEWCGCIAIALTSFTRKRLLALSICVLVHFTGEYVLRAWPSWMTIFPHSYCFLQNYNVWSPLPTIYDGSTLRNYVIPWSCAFIFFVGWSQKMGKGIIYE